MTGKVIANKKSEFLSFNGGSLILNSDSIVAVALIGNDNKIYAGGEMYTVRFSESMEDFVKSLGVMDDFHMLNSGLFIRRSCIVSITMGTKSSAKFWNGNIISSVTSNSEYAKYNLDNLDIISK